MRSGGTGRLGDVLRLEYGKPLPPELRSPEGTVPVYGANGIKDWTKTAFRSEPTIIVGRKGSAGEIQLTDGPFWPLDVTYFVDFDRGRHDLKFLYYLLDWIDLRSLAKGIKPGVNRNEAYDIPVSVPPLEEQRRIVAVLDEAFAAIATATANTEKNLANALELFGSVLSEALRDSAGEWEPRELQSLLIKGRKISYGIVKPGRHDPHGVRLIKSQQVRDDSMDLSADFRITKELDKEYARTRLEGGEILLNLVGASIGRSAIAPDEVRGSNVSRAIAVIPVRPELARWVQYNLRGAVGQELIRSRTGGSAQPVLNLSEVKSLPIPLPPPSKQEAIIRRLDELDSEAQHLAQSYCRKVAALSALKASILKSAFSGQLTKREPLAA